MKSVLLAIVIPYYKIAFFEASLQSLVYQTDKRFKVYIGDDASPENPTVLIEKYNEQLNIVYHRFDSNLGSISLTKQWERCIQLTKGEEWLMILGDDDYLDKTVVSSWYASYEFFNQKTTVIRFASKFIYEETHKISEVFVHPVWESATESFYRKHENLTRSSLSEYIFSKTTFKKYRFYHFPLAWHSDDRAWLEFTDNKPIFTINNCSVNVRISKSSISGQENNVFQKDLATREFYKYVITNKLKYYKKLQRQKLLDKYENTIKKTRKLNLSEWFVILFSYLKYYDRDSFKRVLKRYVKTILKYEI